MRHWMTIAITAASTTAIAASALAVVSRPPSKAGPSDKPAPAPAAAPVKGGKPAAPAGQQPDDPFREQIWKQMGAGRPEPKGDPMREVAGSMGDIVEDLGKQETGEPVQTKQKKVVETLDAIIKKMEEQSSSGKAGGSMNPTTGLKKSVLAGGPGGIHDLHDPRAGEKKWGELPPKERDQILQSKTEGFPQGYESMLQSYYRRLSTEQVAPETSTSDTPAAAPTAPTPTAAPAASPAASEKPSQP